MPIQQVEFEFPDPDKGENLQEVEVPQEEPKAEEIEVEGVEGRETIEKPAEKEKVIQAGEVEIEVVDDVPPEDRGRKPSPPPEEVTNEELENYSEKVKNRIKHFSKGYHDERRAKEAAEREREALEQYAKNLINENQQLKSKTDQSHNALIQSARKQVEAELDMAKRQYRQAYESGEPDAVLEAQTMLNAAQIRMERVNGLKPKETAEQQTALQPEQNTVQSQQLAPSRIVTGKHSLSF